MPNENETNDRHVAREESAAWLRRTLSEQGLTLAIKDPEAIERLATLVGDAS